MKRNWKKAWAAWTQLLSGRLGRLTARIPENLRVLLRPACRLLLLMLAAVLALSVLNIFTANRAAAQRLERNEKLLREVLPRAAVFTETAFRDDRAEMIYAGYTKPDEQSGESLLAGYCIKVRAYGFGGPFELLAGINLDGAVTGVKPLSNNEAAGRGNAIGTAGFLRQFVGLSGIITVGEAENAVQAVSGATFSSRAVTEGVNQALAVALDVLDDGTEGETPGEEQPDLSEESMMDESADESGLDDFAQIEGEDGETIVGNP